VVVAGPLTTVLGALSDGAGSLGEVSRRTGLRLDVVRAATDHLVRLGRVQQCPLSIGCAAGGCGGCPKLSDGRCG
jgi:DNA-binding IclR family transcriptional regulator